MKSIENGVYEATQLISGAKVDENLMDTIKKICGLDEYQEATLRTWNKKNDFGFRVSNAALGLTGEAGEVSDIVKKAIYHGHGFDPSHCPGEEDGNTHKLALELGDMMYYISVMAHEMGYTLQDIAEMNIAKLTKRYPNGFSREDSKKRVDVK
ncbi:nucleoside triphosphate pyrophosphohydrolase family protein [Bacillus cereus]|nr:nucleoside triphosphate pyrophosphohydrolase family protein [Bacillus cereus]